MDLGEGGGRVTDYVIVRSDRFRVGASERLQSNPLLDGLGGAGLQTVRLLSPRECKTFLPSQRSCLIFHIFDEEASLAVRRMTARLSAGLVVCLSTDIYSLKPFLEVADIVDFFVVPSDIHRLVLSAGVPRLVFTVRECLDPIALDEDSQTTKAAMPQDARRRLFWFGYSSSFDNAMASLTPVLQLALSKGILDSVDLITDGIDIMSPHGFSIKPFSNSTFGQMARLYDYCILSHFALDLRLNSFIKSSNKLTTALSCGTVPLVSDTPNYARLYRKFGLDQFIYDSPASLMRLLSKLDPKHDKEMISKSGILSYIQSELTPQNVCADFLAACRRYKILQSSGDLSIVPPLSLQPAFPESVRFYATGLLTSVRRSLRTRLRKTGVN